MAILTQYTLDYLITNPITRNGKILISFNNDFTLTSGMCSATILGATTTTTCDPITINGINYLQYKINGSINSIIPGNTKIQIIYPAIISNALYPRTYSFGLYLYYNDNDLSLV